MGKTYVVRTMIRSDLDTAVSWATAEGWNPGLFDAECFFQIDPNGFFIGFLGDEPIACITAVAYDSQFGFLGFYICRKEYRNQGYGIQVWNGAIDYLGNRNIGLDGVVAQQENYKKSGFAFAYNNARYQCTSKPFPVSDPHIISVAECSIDEIIVYDKPFFPADRSKFLRCWLTQPESSAFVYKANNTIQGYGMIRKCQTGYKIGPLFADSFVIADTLFQTLVNSIPVGVQVTLDIPEINPDAIKLVQKHEMVKSFSTARMYTKTPPKLPQERIYGITTFEVG